MEFGRNLVSMKLPGTHKDDPHIRLLTIVGRVPELVFFCNQIGNYPNYHHRAFIQELMKSGTEMLNQALG